MSAQPPFGPSVAPPLLSVRDLRTWIEAPGGTVRAVDGVSFDLARGETLALLGESGSGKSVTAASILRLLPPAARVRAGEIRLDGHDLLALPEREMRAVRGLRIGMVFQEPMLCLDPVMRVGAQIDQALRRRHPEPGPSRRRRAIDLLRSVGFPEAASRIDDYPFQLSGGMRQRVMLAIALAAEPDLLVADEPTTALDVTTQAQVLDLLVSAVRARGMGLLLITHDLGVVARCAQRVAVMYAGEVVEAAPVDRFLRGPRHPYSRRLLEAIPGPGSRHRPLPVIPGTVPMFASEPSGCRFHTRCHERLPGCERERPQPRLASDGHAVRCLRVPPATSGPDPLAVAEAPGPGGHDADGLPSDRVRVAPAAGLSPGAGGRSPDCAAGVAPPGAIGEAGSPAMTDPVATRGEPASALLEVHALSVRFPVRGGLLRQVRGWVRAVEGVDLRIARGRTLALVGESGCGKTTVGKAVLGLIESAGGEIRYDGTDLRALGRTALRPLRARMQIVFQDPYSSLDPRMRIEDTLDEGMRALRPQWDARERGRRIDRLLEEVGLPADARRRYPHQFSGGQRQRVAIARALSVEPELLVCDEPTSALDVSVQAQVLNLLRELQHRRGLACLFITHNLGVVEAVADDLSVMYLGRIVEQGPAARVLAAPAHPYTRALLAAVPRIDPQRSPEVPGLSIPAELPSNRVERRGCDYRNRCALAQARCASESPPRLDVGPGHVVCCHAAGSCASGPG